MTNANLHICFVYAPQDESFPEAASHISGTAWTLHIHRLRTGNFYPHVAEATSAQEYRFFAGRVPATPLLAHFPVGHFVTTLESEGPARDADPLGSWLALKLDRRADLLTAAADRRNGQRWFYTQYDRAWYLSNSLRYLCSLLPISPEIDPLAVSALIRWGMLPGRLTPLAKILKLDAGEVLTVSPARSAVTPCTEPPLHEGTPHSVISLLMETVARETDGLRSIVLPLSGGLHSRALLGAALAVMPREAITTLTYGSERSWDFRLGTALAHKLGVGHIALESDHRAFSEILHDNFASSEGCADIVPDYPVAPYADALPQAAFVLSGVSGIRPPAAPPAELPLLVADVNPVLPAMSALPDVVPARQKAFYLTPLCYSSLQQQLPALPAALKTAFPELYAFPTTRNSGASLIAPRAAVRWQRTFSRLALQGEREILEHTEYREYLHSVFAALRALPSLNPEGLQTLQRRYQRRQSIAPATLHALVTLHQWLQQFRQFD